MRVVCAYGFHCLTDVWSSHVGGDHNGDDTGHAIEGTSEVLSSERIFDPRGSINMIDSHSCLIAFAVPGTPRKNFLIRLQGGPGDVLPCVRRQDALA